MRICTIFRGTEVTLMNKKQNPVASSVKQSFRNHPGAAALAAFCIFGSVITALIPPLVLEAAVDRITEKHEVSLFLALLYPAAIVLSDLFESAQGASVMMFGQKLTHGLRSALCRKLNRLGAGYFTSHDSGRITSVFVNDADAVDALYSDGIIGMIADSTKVVSILAVIFTKSIGLGLVLLCVIPILFWITRVFQKKMLRAQLDNRSAVAKVNGHIPETIRNIRMIHGFRKERYMEEKYDEAITESYRAVNRSNLYDSIYPPVILLTEAVVIAVMMTGAAGGDTMRRFFGLSVGSAVAVIAYVGKIFSPLESIGTEIQNIQSAMAGIRRINDFLREKEMPETEEISVPDNADKTIVFQRVTFGYRSDTPVLTNFSFTVRPGEQVTFMGRTGAGKSTIFRLLTGLYRPDGGSVRVAGIDPSALSQADRRTLYGLVEQNFTTVPGTVRDQITLYDPAISEEAVAEALKLVRLSDTVRSLPNGADTEMKDGLFSRGELQLLAIARAVAASPQILLLDEITANLDSETEARVLSALRKVSEKRTVLSVSHRFSGLMKDERIIEVGT